MGPPSRCAAVALAAILTLACFYLTSSNNKQAPAYQSWSHAGRCC